MGLLYLPTFTIKFNYKLNVGKDISPVDDMGK